MYFGFFSDGIEMNIRCKKGFECVGCICSGNCSVIWCMLGLELLVMVFEVVLVWDFVVKDLVVFGDWKENM